MMTATEAKTLKYGDVVRYIGVDGLAIVQRVTKNGVWISFDGVGPRHGQCITDRVAARYLERVK